MTAILSAADRKMCHASIRAGSKSFHAASLMLPPKARLAARSLYAFCRSSDDLVDEGDGDGHAAERLRKRLNLIYQGQPIDLVCDRAYAFAVSKYGIPHEIPEALIEGFEWDEAGRHYKTIDDLLDYAARVASTVGVMMAVVMGCRDSHGLARAADLGLAMQLTNIARDVGEDARNGRIYLPSDWLDEEGVDLKTLSTTPAFSPALGRVVERLLDEADIFYKRALVGVGVLPIECRPAIRSAALIYQAIGKEIRKNNFNSVDQRAHTSKRRKIELMAYATMTPFPMMPISTVPAHRSVQFLVDVSAHKVAAPIKGVDAKAGRMIELLGKSIQHQNEMKAQASQKAGQRAGNA